MYIPGSEFTQKIATVCMIHQVPLSVALPIKTVTLEMCNYFFVMILTGIFGLKNLFLHVEVTRTRYKFYRQQIWCDVEIRISVFDLGIFYYLIHGDERLHLDSSITKIRNGDCVYRLSLTDRKTNNCTARCGLVMLTEAIYLWHNISGYCAHF